MPENIFMGHTVAYWVELETGTFKKGTRELIEEIAELRSKVSFYESRINEISNFMNRNLEVKPKC